MSTTTWHVASMRSGKVSFLVTPSAPCVSESVTMRRLSPSRAKAKAIEKTRYIVLHEGNRWEVDEFHGHREGLILAELEVPSEDYTFPLPSFVGREVTGQPQYYNSAM